MEEKQPKEKKKRTIAAKIGRTLLGIVVVILVLLISVALLILTPPVQNFARKKATSWLSNKLNTRVEIGRIYIGFPKKIVLEKIYVEDQQKDTLLSGGKLKVDIAMLKLLNNEVQVSQVEVSELTAKVKRQLPDTTYNFQFIIDAFATPDQTETQSTDSSSMQISVKDIELNKIRLVYDDVVTGNDVTVWLEHFDTEIDVFDLDKMKFSVPETNISGIRANVYQRTPLVQPAEAPADTASAAEPIALDFDFDELNLSDIHLDYGNDVSAMYTKLDLGKLELRSDDIDLQHQSIILDKIQLDNTTATVRLGKTPGAKDVEEAAKETAARVAETAPGDSVEFETGNNWRVLVKSIRLNNNNIAFNNENDPAARQGMDFAHLDARQVTLHADNFFFSPDSISASIRKGTLREKSGFQLNTFETDFLYAANEAYLHDLLIETPGTTLRRSASIRYPSLEAVQKDIGKLQLDIDLDDSRIQVKDILTFAPFLSAQPAFSNPSSMLMVDGNIHGSVANMNIERLRVRAFNNTSMDVRGRISGLPDANKINGNLAIQSFRTSRKDIQLLAPKGSLPTNITIPEMLNLRGGIAGSMASARANLDLTTSLGSASVKGSISNATDKKRARYNAVLAARELNLGVIMQNDTMFGPLSATITASGTGFDPKTASAKLNAVITSATLNRYLYTDVRLEGQLASQKASFSFDVHDPNISVALQGTTDLSGKFPALTLDATIDSIKPRELHFMTDTLAYAGKITADFPNTDPANLEGRLLVTNSIVSIPGQRVAMDTLALTSGNDASGKFLTVRSDALHFSLTGQYNLVQLGSVFQQAIQPYYAMGAANKDTLQDYDFTFRGQLINGPLLKTFVPTMDSLQNVTFDGRFATNQGFGLNLGAPLVIMGGNRIDKLSLRAGTENNAIQLRTQLEKFSAGPSMVMYATSIDASIANNSINFLMNLKDAANKNKYRLGGRLDQPKPGAYSLVLNPDSLLLNYDRWTIAANNLIKLDSGDVNITNFTISNKGQQLSINSVRPDYNSPMNVSFGNFRIATLTAFAKQDSLLVDGTINGSVVLTNIPEQPTFTSDLTISNLMFRADTVGNLVMKVNNNTANVFDANITLTGYGNDIAINGTYNVKPANQSVMDMTLDIRKLQMTALESMAMGAISRARGYISGKFDIAGTFDKPAVNGDLAFNQTGFSPSMLGSYFTIDKENISVNNEGISFNSFSVLDSSRNELTLDGTAYTTNFINYRLDLGLTADNFQALNSTKLDNRLFYGQFNFDTDLRITGTEASPKIDGSLMINEKTDFTIVLPQSEPGVVDREGIIRFVDMDSLRVDSTVSLASVDSVAKADITGMDVSVNIEVNKEAIMTIVVDESNGDFLRMKGTAELNGGIDPSGKTTLTGTYTIEEGAYEMSLNFLKRRFEIQKGSEITWLGEPTKADINLTAVYVANAAPLTLVEHQAEIPVDPRLKQKLPFHVHLILKGELLKPEISFDLMLPENQNLNVAQSVIDLVEPRLDQLKSQPSELNKQVFALLLLNRFVSENPFASSGGDGFNAGSVARQSVSQLLTDQLNDLAADLISGVDLNFDLASSEDYNTGKMQNRTDLNVSLSKDLLNDRLKVTVGSNFELEGPQTSNQRQNNLAGNVALDYLLSKDGRYMIRAYRKNEYEAEIEGYIIETGLNFILTVDYNHISEMFYSQKEKKLSRQKKKLRTSATDSTKSTEQVQPDKSVK